MKLGIMQPYFFPNLAHFALILSVDHWIVFDISQYTHKSWITRNRVLHPKSGWNYFSLPIERSSTSLKISDIRVKSLLESEKMLLGKISHYKKHAPYYHQVISLVKKTFDLTKNHSLVELNIRSLAVVCQYLAIEFQYEICSELDIVFPDKMLAGQWAPYISEHLQAKEYINPIGGKFLFALNEFEQRNISLSFAEFIPYQYQVSGYEFEDGLSILDVMMWNSPEKIHEVLIKHTNLS